MPADQHDAQIHAIVPAAGAGRRLAPEAKTPKQYRSLLGRTLLQWSVDVLARHPAIAAVTVVLAPGDTDFTRLSFAGAARVDWAVGGETRAHSVRNAITHVAQTSGAPWVLVHDAARPCLDRPSLDRLIETGLAHADGAILARPVSDTLKRARVDDRQQASSTGTVTRDGLWAAQTPQLFPTDRLAAALDERLAAGLPPTDEAGAMEDSGASPLLVPGAPTNLKITWPGDMALAEAILRQAERQL